MSDGAGKNSIILTNVITALVAVIGTSFASLGDRQADTTAQLKNAYERIAQLEESDRKTRQLVLQQATEIVELRARLSENVSRVELLQSFLNALPYPAWVKEYCGGPPLRMVMLNEQYTVEYKKTTSEYIGRTDYDVYPYDIALMYEKADMRVIESGKSIYTVEPVMVDGELFDLHVHKFIINIQKDGCVGVAGTAMRILHHD